MQQQLLYFLQQYPQFAIAISLLASILIAVLGVVPSVFITGANILFFGFWNGVLISFLGEALGAAVSFWLYRKGFKKASQKGLQKFSKAKQLVEVEGAKAFTLILTLRLLPFVPSGLITFAASVGKVSFINFLTASSLGKIPALLIEAYSVNEVINRSWQGTVIVAVVAIVFLFLIVKNITGERKKKRNQ